MNLSISNIGWSNEYDEDVYELMKQYGFKGLEIAPSRIFQENAYEKLKEASIWAEEINKKYGLVITSMQSIWYGRSEKLFGSREERKCLLEYTKKAIVFANAIHCKNLVFGCPRNRVLPQKTDPSIAIDFFRELGEYATKLDTVIAIEANPTIYNTNYINRTDEAIEIIKQVASDGIKLNLDLGTIIENDENLNDIKGYEKLINHVHVSEPGLKIIKKRDVHEVLVRKLNECNYDGWISIEMGKQDSIRNIEETMSYVEEVFG